MRRNKRICWLAVALWFVLLLGYSMPISDCDGSRFQSAAIDIGQKGNVALAGIPHDPIHIDGDANFTDTALLEGWEGNGSLAEPFIIENLDIDSGGTATPCIHIANTQLHFIIRNCNLQNATGGYGSGVRLQSVTNGEISSNLCSNNRFGILTSDSSANCTLINNTCVFNSVSGIQLDTSFAQLVQDNDCSNCGEGILANYGNGHTIRNNTFVSNLHGIALQSSSSNLVADNTVSNNQHGIYVYEPLFQHTFAQPQFNTIVNNTCSGNEKGIRMEMASNNIVINNTFNNFIGISIAGLSNVVLWNVFLDFFMMVEASGTSTSFDCNYYWEYDGVDANGDGFGDDPYAVGPFYDEHPLMFLPTPPRWTQVPYDQNVEWMSSVRYDLNATAPAPIFWSVNDTAHFTIDSQGVLESNGILSLGNYPVQVSVANIYGVRVFARFSVHVADTTPPGWIIAPQDLAVDYGEGVDLQIAALDLSGIDHWTLNDTIHFALSAIYYELGSVVRITNNSALGPGPYVLNITASDPFENSLSVIFSVTIESPKQDTTPPVWVTLYIYQTIQHGEGMDVVLEAWDESGIDHWWLNDTTHFTIDELGVIRNATTLVTGVYSIEVRAYDPYDNYCLAILVVTVLEAPTTTTTTTTTTTSSTTTITTTTTTSQTSEGASPVLTLALGAGIGGAAVLMLVVVLLKKK
ncbi:MAG: hypothetical protein EAX95_03340 [Candidatus Thorarchaeota archaeon]|nr:hypothetical protein [Candidatus Thorarchaeota archaeon]